MRKGAAIGGIFHQTTVHLIRETSTKGPESDGAPRPLAIATTIESRGFRIANPRLLNVSAT